MLIFTLLKCISQIWRSALSLSLWIILIGCWINKSNRLKNILNTKTHRVSWGGGGGCLLIWKEIYRWAAGEWVLPSYLLLFKDIPCIVEMNWKYIWRKIVDALPFTKYPCQSPNNDPCSLSVTPKSNIAGGVNTGQTFKLHFRIICAPPHTNMQQKLKKKIMPQEYNLTTATFFHPRFRKSVSLREESFSPG